MHAAMCKALTSLFLGLAGVAWINFAAVAASEPCKDCNPDTRITVREQIKADRAREVDRVAKESSDRPWDGQGFRTSEAAPFASSNPLALTRGTDLVSGGERLLARFTLEAHPRPSVDQPISGKYVRGAHASDYAVASDKDPHELTAGALNDIL